MCLTEVEPDIEIVLTADGAEEAVLRNPRLSFFGWISSAALRRSGRRPSCPAYRRCERLRVLSGPPSRLWVCHDSLSKEGSDVVSP
jgi:hypothetical protein